MNEGQCTNAKAGKATLADTCTSLNTHTHTHTQPGSRTRSVSPGTHPHSTMDCQSEHPPSHSTVAGSTISCSAITRLSSISVAQAIRKCPALATSGRLDRKHLRHCPCATAAAWERMASNTHQWRVSSFPFGLRQHNLWGRKLLQSSQGRAMDLSEGRAFHPPCLR
ncbi:hypothetical protein DUNSADRAFT_16759 [Dunaliella salina]|uniref:Encoded protein n=1 Tax=Dunaliella salina TaxID=3046 RepID=A0ABQ7G2X8_DUNSA|nr:hypothetical protein DUNSADRAFT_16759 [Dunaliella salina]|eukprot:KAF5828962.1 hypothetical protein DUNSADRAFT_16759 [Dunaliella salina]